MHPNNQPVNESYFYHLNNVEFNPWVIYQPSYINVPYGYIPNDLYAYQSHNFVSNSDNRQGIYNFNGINKCDTIPNIPTNIEYRKPNQTVNSANCDNPRSNIRYDRRNKHDYVHKSKEDSNNSKFKSQNNDNKLNVRKYEILKRGTKLESETNGKSSESMKLNFDTDFPPIASNCSKLNSEGTLNFDLDYKLALQKPKSVIPDFVLKTKSEKLNVEPEVVEKKKKKRNRKRKPKKVQKEQFLYAEEEFPDLQTVKLDENIEKPKHIISDNMNDQDTFNGINSVRKCRRSQFLLLLPSDVSDQMKIVPMPSKTKNKVKSSKKLINDRPRKIVTVMNPLDLSGPAFKRGKERLKPKIKKPSKLKKIILMHRKQKKEHISESKNSKINEIIGESVTAKETPPQSIVKSNKHNQMHNKTFREYCNHMVDININNIITDLLKTLIGFQDKMHHRDPVKAKIKRRLCYGLREVTKYITIRRLRLIIIAPDLEKIEDNGGLDDVVLNIIEMSRNYGIPCVFGLSRSSLAYLCFKKYRVAAVGIFNYDGAEVKVKELLIAVDTAREQYNQISKLMESMAESNKDENIDNSISVGSHLQANQINTLDLSTDEYANSSIVSQSSNIVICHSRTPSNALSEPISDVGDMNKSIFDCIREQCYQTNNMYQKTYSTVEDFINDVEGSQSHNEDDGGCEGNEEVQNQLIDEFVDDILSKVANISLYNENDETKEDVL